jgi:NAD(P)-dependent dehydrogenase (short-subunit alcohol dehydrogenase family)
MCCVVSAAVWHPAPTSFIVSHASAIYSRRGNALGVGSKRQTCSHIANRFSPVLRATMPTMEHHSPVDMLKPLSGRIVIVTGASRGVGRGIAVGLGESGATVFITGRRSVELEETARLVRESGGQCFPSICNHERDEDVQAFFANVENYLSSSGAGLPLFLLVNNAFAGAHYIAESQQVPLWNKSVTNPDVADPSSPPGAYWDKINNVGLRSNYVASIHALRMMIPRGSGLVINISSFGGTVSVFDPVYGAGKCANDRMVSEIAKSLTDPIDTGVRMLTLYPGIVSTEIIVKAFESSSVVSGPGVGPSTDASTGALQDLMWNAESPVYIGRVIAAIAADSKTTTLTRRNGNIVIAAEAGQRYGIRDVNGEERYSLRSLRTLALAAVPALHSYSIRHLIPDVYVPWFLVKMVAGASPGLAR